MHHVISGPRGFHIVRGRKNVAPDERIIRSYADYALAQVVLETLDPSGA